MKCKKAETFISRSLDGLLTLKEKDALEGHIRDCSACQRKMEEYTLVIGTLRDQDFPEAKSYFWERLQPRIRDQRKLDLWSLWKRWSLRAVPLSIIAVITLALGSALFLPQPKDELSQTGDLLLRNSPPLPETITLLEEEGTENKSIRIIFTAMEEKKDTGRYFP